MKENGMFWERVRLTYEAVNDTATEGQRAAVVVRLVTGEEFETTNVVSECDWGLFKVPDGGHERGVLVPNQDRIATVEVKLVSGESFGFGVENA